MSLAPGVRLGPYEIVFAIGAGGMGEVYRARDSRLGRDVAVKILPAAFVADADRVARFEREARLISQLNHPNICALYDIAEAPNPQSHIPNPDRIQFLVLELVDGPTLADRIAQGPRGIPIDETLVIARQIAAALEAAHENGIIHRDLKPANIKLTHDGTVKVLDFGLAKALERGAGSTTQSPTDLSHSPTITSPAMNTNAGIIMGTAVYMSPEQAKGKPADKRSDIWAFGCVMYEMLTGKRAFDGEDLTDVVAAVVRGEPDWTALPADLPPHIHTLLKGCFRKDRKARLGDIAVVRYLLDQETTLPVAPTTRVAQPSRGFRTLVSWAAGSLTFAAIVTALMFWQPWVREAVPAPPLRLQAQIGADGSLADFAGASAVLSPDGSVMAFVASKGLGGDLALYVRRLDQLQAALLAGTEGALNPFFSPDGKWIGFFTVGKLKKIAVSGGSAVTLCDAPNGRGGSWSEDGSIIFTPTGSPATTLLRVSSEGGTPEKLTDIAPGEVSQRWPQVLPGGHAVIFTSAQTTSDYGTANIVAQPLPGGERKVLIKGGTYGRYVRSGHLVYFRERTLFAVPFDVARLEVTGPAVPALEGARANAPSGGVQVDVADNGTLVYVPGDTLGDTSAIRWLDRSGQLSMLRSTPSNWSNPSFSPDGRTLAVDIYDGRQSDVWVYDWERDTLSRRTFDPADDQRPVWTPDGTRIVFASRRDSSAAFNLYWQRADGTGDVQRLTTSKNRQFPTSFHPNGRLLSFLENTSGGLSDVMILPIDGDEKTEWKPGTPTAFLNAPYSESSAMFSPDGLWIAYISNEGGRNEIFVQPYPGPGGKYQVSATAGDDPTWSRVAPELFFLNGADLRLMVVPYRIDGGAFRADKPTALNETKLASRPRPPSRDLDLHPDGKRFAVAGTEDLTGQKVDSVVFVFNFFDELRRIAPPKN